MRAREGGPAALLVRETRSPSGFALPVRHFFRFHSLLGFGFELTKCLVPVKKREAQSEKKSLRRLLLVRRYSNLSRLKILAS